MTDETLPPIRTTRIPARVGRFAMRFSSTPRGARLARHLTGNRLQTWDVPYDSTAHGDNVLIVAELAANAVQHGRVPGRDFRLALPALGQTVRVEVTDTRPELGPAVRQRPADHVTAGCRLVVVGMRRGDVTNAEWALLEPHLPSTGLRGGRWMDHRKVINGILIRVRPGIPWRDLPERFGSRKTVYERHRRWSADGMWDRILRAVQTDADLTGRVDWSMVSVDSTSCRAHQHAAGARKKKLRLPKKSDASAPPPR